MSWMVLQGLWVLSLQILLSEMCLEYAESELAVGRYNRS